MENDIKSILTGLRHIAKQLDDMKPKLGVNNEKSDIKLQSDSLSNIHAALANFHLDIEPLYKDATSYTGKFSSLPAIILHVEKPLAKQGISFTQELTDYCGQLFAYTVLRHESGEYISSRTPIFLPQRDEIPTNKDYNQECGKAISYMKRYALESILGLKADDQDYERAHNGK